MVTLFVTPNGLCACPFTTLGPNATASSSLLEKICLTNNTFFERSMCICHSCSNCVSTNTTIKCHKLILVMTEPMTANNVLVHVPGARSYNTQYGCVERQWLGERNTRKNHNDMHRISRIVR